MKPRKRVLDTCRIPGITANDGFAGGPSSLMRRGHISPGLVDRGTTTTLSRIPFWTELDTTRPGRVFPNSGGEVTPRLIQ